MNYDKLDRLLFLIEDEISEGMGYPSEHWFGVDKDNLINIVKLCEEYLKEETK